MELRVQDVKEGRRARLAGGQLNRLQRGIDTGERDIVGGNGHRERLRNIEDVVNDVDGDISGGGDVGYNGVVSVMRVKLQ